MRTARERERERATRGSHCIAGCQGAIKRDKQARFNRIQKLNTGRHAVIHISPEQRTLDAWLAVAQWPRIGYIADLPHDFTDFYSMAFHTFLAKYSYNS